MLICINGLKSLVFHSFHRQWMSLNQIFASCSPQVPGNWSDSTSYLATISQPAETNLSTIVPEIREGRNTTFTTTISDLNRTVVTITSGLLAGPPVLAQTLLNQSTSYEYKTKNQQDQCWETYVGQVCFKHLAKTTYKKTDKTTFRPRETYIYIYGQELGIFLPYSLWFTLFYPTFLDHYAPLTWHSS